MFAYNEWAKLVYIYLYIYKNKMDFLIEPAHLLIFWFILWRIWVNHLKDSNRGLDCVRSGFQRVTRPTAALGWQSWRLAPVCALFTRSESAEPWHMLNRIEHETDTFPLDPQSLNMQKMTETICERRGSRRRCGVWIWVLCRRGWREKVRWEESRVKRLGMSDLKCLVFALGWFPQSVWFWGGGVLGEWGSRTKGPSGRRAPDTGWSVARASGERCHGGERERERAMEAGRGRGEEWTSRAGSGETWQDFPSFVCLARGCSAGGNQEASRRRGGGRDEPRLRRERGEERKCRKERRWSDFPLWTTPVTGSGGPRRQATRF